MKKVILLSIIAAGLVLGCPSSFDPTEDQLDFAEDFMLTFETERISGIASRGIQPILMGDGPSVSPKATVPAGDASPLSFTTSSGSFSNYPLPGLTTAYTLAAAPAVGADVYEVVSTTTYPASHVISTYVESYYIKNITVGDDTADEWNWNDPIVDAAGAADPAARIAMIINYRDGSVRTEEIVKLIYEYQSEDGFAAFDIQGSLNYPDFAYPASDPGASFSSVVVYTHHRNQTHNYWFWEGTEQQQILGVRYYTEHSLSGGEGIQGTTVSYERAVSSYNTTGGDAIDLLDDVFMGTTLTTLGESVFRQRVIFDNTGSAPQATLQDSVMKSHVVNAEDYADFLVQKLNDDEIALSDWENAPYYIPSGTGAAEIAAEDPQSNEYLSQTVITNPDGNNLVINDAGHGDLAALYSSITNGFFATNTIAVGDDIIGGLEGDGTVAEFDRNEGYEIPTETALEMAASAGTVEAWVYVESHANTAGIVHKGSAPDFSDEAYSLQFMGSKGNVAFAIVKQSPYKYTLAQSSLRLNTGKWYFLAGTYDASTVKLYIFGEGVTQGRKNYYVKSVTNSIGAPLIPGGPLVIGSQFTEADRKNNYYGFDGFINGVRVDNIQAKTAAELEAYYNDNKAKTAAWN